MKSSLVLAVTGAALASAGPLALLKKALVVDYVYEYVTVTVTADEHATYFGPGKHRRPHVSTTSTSTSTTLEVSTTSTPTPTSTPEPEPVVATSSEAPVVVEPSPVIAITVEAAPTVEIQSVASTVAEAVPEVAAPTQQAAAAPTDYASTAVYHHNLHRLNHSAPSVTFSDTHAGYAQQTAQKCVFAHDLTPGNGGYGQNLALWGSTNAKSLGASTAVAQATTNMWYNGEINQFPSSSYGLDNPDMSNFEAFGHYTQLIWKGTTQVGCYTQYCEAGTIYSDMGSWFTVCNYFPAGNMGGAYGANVLPPLGEGTVTA